MNNASQTFETWMYAVNAVIESKTGLSADDLPDVCYHDLYEDDASPSAAARYAIRNAQESVRRARGGRRPLHPFITTKEQKMNNDSDDYERAPTFIDLGYGTESAVIDRLPVGTWTVIRDDDAARVGAPCWIATTADQETAEAEHERLGGTVSASFVHSMTQTDYEMRQRSRGFV